MTPLHALHVVNDIALGLLGEAEPEALTAGFLRKLLYHSGLAVAILATRHKGGPTPPGIVKTLGNRDLARQEGTSPRWLEQIVSAETELLSDLALANADFEGAERYRHGLRLVAGDELVVVLLGVTPTGKDYLARVFAPVLPAFARAYALSRAGAAHAKSLAAEIAERRRVEATQQAVEAQAQAVFELSPQPMLVLDLATRKITFANAQLRQLLGLPADALPEAYALWTMAVRDPEVRRALRAELRSKVGAALRSGGRFDAKTLRVRAHDGSERIVQLHAQLTAGKAVVSLVDLTAQKQQEADLEAAKDAAVRASVTKSRFISSVSHEIRTPLNAILGFAQLLESDEHASDVQRSHAREIVESGQHLLALVDDVLDLERVESGHVTVNLVPVSLGAIARECLNLVDGDALSRAIQLRIMESGPAVVVADPTRLRQVIINLLTNGIKYNVVGGRVTLFIGPGDAGRVRMAVTDTGPGIPEAKIGELFQPFKRLGAEHDNVAGSGLGLALAKQLLERMHGLIGCESVVGVGSTFWFELPSAEATPRVETASPKTARRERVDPRAARRPRILVVEDHPMNQRLLCLQLDQAGSYEVLVASDGAQALEVLRQTPVDLVITDCNMPVMDGFELTAAVRKDEQQKGTRLPIVAVTASAMKEDAARCLAAGMDACLAKPVSAAALAETVEQWLTRSGAGAARVQIVTGEVGAAGSRGRIITGEVNDGGDAGAQVHRRLPYLLAIEAMIGSSAGRASAEGLLSEFASDTDLAMATIAQAHAAGDLSSVAQLLHRMKPSARLVGATMLVQVADSLERAAKDGDHTLVAELHPALTQTWAAIRSDLVRPGSGDVSPSIQPSSARTGLHARARDRGRLRGLSALVIEDDPFTRRYANELLSGFGVARVVVAEEGQAGLDAMRHAGHDIDIILCDLAMPGMDGVEFLRHLTGRDFGGSIILMSGAEGRVLGSVSELARQHGMTVLGTLQKPFTANALETLLSQHRPTMARKTRETRLLSVDPAELEAAIVAGQITVHYQPKVHAMTLAVAGVEVLARWFRRDGTAVSPAAFVRIAEQHGLDDLLFESVLAQALAGTARLVADRPSFKVAVNVSAASLARVDAPERILAKCLEAGVDPGRLVLEVTETGLVRDLKVALDVLTRLRLHGIELSIDDFGTGYSSIDLLRRVPFTELKIDRTFVANGVRDASARHIAASSVALARGLGMRVVAEGVETPAELALVRELGCDEIQGYFVARPMDEGSFGSWLTQRTRETPRPSRTGPVTVDPPAANSTVDTTILPP